MTKAANRPTNGRGVDATGGPVIDPTANVVALTEAAVKRQDDLREASDKLTAMQVAQVKELAAIRAEYTQRLSEAEAKRIDAIRAVDVNAVAVASERQAAAATVLANQVAQSADALRTLVATTAATIAEQQRQQFSQFTDRLTVVERSQYEGRGKEQVVDPQFAKLIDAMEALRTSQNVGSGKSAGASALWGYIVGAVGLGAVLATLAMKLGQ